ncbi:MAG: hypothetical protein GTO24_18095 [candidate division Zixibacteria bacterium]|nr:hypothetical protein [candidate division Zixibacteria bacterium]
MKKEFRWTMVFFLAAVQVFGLLQLGLAQHRDRYDRPIPMGVSISTTPTEPFLAAGTAGMLVRNLSIPIDLPIRFILSTNHVAGAVGPTLCPNTAIPLLNPILQPGTLDIGSDPSVDREFVVGLFVQSVPIILTPPVPNSVDAAIAITARRFANPEILGIGFPTPEVGQAELDMDVTKSGRASGVTNGKVDAINVTVSVEYDTCGTARFVDQIMFSDMSDPGDSGSVILESNTLKPVALLFAESNTNTVGNPFSAVVEALNVFPVGEESAISEPTSLDEVMARIRSRKVDPRLERLKNIQERHEGSIMSLADVVGIGIGSGKDGQGYEFVVYSERLGPEITRQVPQQIEGVPVRLKESGPFKAN